MRRLFCSLVIVSLLVLTGCTTAFPKQGFLFTDVKGPYQVGEGDVPSSKTGTSCSQMFLGLVSIGDGSILGAKNQGKITKVSTVDYSYFGVGPFYEKTCVIVSGS